MLQHEVLTQKIIDARSGIQEYTTLPEQDQQSVDDYIAAILASPEKQGFIGKHPNYTTSYIANIYSVVCGNAFVQNLKVRKT